MKINHHCTNIYILGYVMTPLCAKAVNRLTDLPCSSKTSIFKTNKCTKIEAILGARAVANKKTNL